MILPSSIFSVNSLLKLLPVVIEPSSTLHTYIIGLIEIRLNSLVSFSISSISIIERAGLPSLRWFKIFCAVSIFLEASLSPFFL